MTIPILMFIAGCLVLAGFVKGVAGLGLPAISMGLLALVMTPADAASVLILPTVATNIWQMAAGPSLKPIVARLWPVLLGVICGTLAGAGWLVDTHGHYGTALLGIALAVYASSGLASIPFFVPPPPPPRLCPLT